MGLHNVQVIGGEIDIHNNDNLISISALSNLNEINGSLKIQDNYSLPNLSGLENIKDVKGDLVINANSLLSGFFSLSNLESVEGEVIIRHSTSLFNLEGLEKLNTIKGNFCLIRNINLADISSLDNVSTIEGEIIIQGNDKLGSLEGLGNVDHTLITNLTLEDSDTLAICHVESICKYLDAGGPHSISANEMGCNSADEVEDACALVSNTSFFEESQVRLFPNPARNKWHVFFEGRHVSQGKLLLFSTTGKFLKAFVLNEGQNTFDRQGLTSGLYFYEILVEGVRLEWGKLVFE